MKMKKIMRSIRNAEKNLITWYKPNTATETTSKGSSYNRSNLLNNYFILENQPKTASHLSRKQNLNPVNKYSTVRSRSKPSIGIYKSSLSKEASKSSDSGLVSAASAVASSHNSKIPISTRKRCQSETAKKGNSEPKPHNIEIQPNIARIYQHNNPKMIVNHFEFNLNDTKYQKSKQIENPQTHIPKLSSRFLASDFNKEEGFYLSKRSASPPPLSSSGFLLLNESGPLRISRRKSRKYDSLPISKAKTRIPIKQGSNLKDLLTRYKKPDDLLHNNTDIWNFYDNINSDDKFISEKLLSENLSSSTAIDNLDNLFKNMKEADQKNKYIFRTMTNVDYKKDNNKCNKFNDLSANGHGFSEVIDL